MEDSNLVPTGGAVLVQFEKYVRRRLLIYAEGVRPFTPKTFAKFTLKAFANFSPGFERSENPGIR